MSHNPYTPPSSPVDDVSVASTVDPEGKRDVLRACMLMWTSFGISLISQLMTIYGYLGGQAIMVIAGLIGLAIGVGIGFLLNWWVTSRLKLGRNWMRILLTVLAACGVLIPLLFWNFYKTQVFPIYSRNVPVLVLSLVQYALWLVALGLLYTARSRNWFAAMKQAGA